MSYGSSAFGRDEFGGDHDALVSSDTYPHLALEFAFTPGVWTNDTADLREWNTDRGRGDESGQMRSGTLDLMMDNRNRQWDPEHASNISPGNLLPGIGVRLTATFNSVTYPVYTGFVDRIEQVYQYPHESRVLIQCSDALSVLQAATLPESVYQAEVLTDSPVAWWKLGEPQDQTTAFDSIGSRDGTYFDSPTAESPGIVAFDGGSSRLFDHMLPNRVEVPGNIIRGYPFSIEAVIQVSPTDTAFRIIYDEEYSSAPFDETLFFFVDDNSVGRQGTLGALLGVTGSVTRFDVHSTARVDDGAPHHVAVVANAVNDVRLYIDGVLDSVQTVAGTSAFPAGSYRIGLGNAPAFSTDIGQYAIGGELQEVAVYGTALSAARVAAHASAATGPWNGDTSGQRFARILDFLDWPAADRDYVTTDQSILQSGVLGTTALTYLSLLESGEGGRLYVRKNGDLTFEGRHQKWQPPYNVPAYVFGDAPGELPYQGIGFITDKGSVRNEAIVQREGGVRQRSVNQTSIARYGTRTISLTGLMNASDAESRDHGDFVVAQLGSVTNRLPSLVVNPRRDATTMFPVVLGLEIGARLQIKRRPQGVGSPIIKEVLVEGIKVEADASSKTMVFTYFVSEIDALKVWVLDDPVSSILDSTTRLGW